MNTEFTVYTKAYGALTIPHLQTPPEQFNLVTHGGTASLTAYVPDDTTRDNLLQYSRHAGSYTINDTLNNTRRYRETIPDSTTIGSLLIGVEPNTELKNEGVRGFYGLVRQVSDARTPAFTNPAVSLEVDVLAAYSEYSSLSVAEDALRLDITAPGTTTLNPVPDNETRTNDADTTDTVSSPWVVQGTGEVQGTVEVQN